LDKHGCACTICGFSFGKHFGKIGEGFIHVHHLIPLAKIGNEYQVDPIKDLIPVCPNCHTMLHRRDPPYTIEELQNKIGIRRKQGSASKGAPHQTLGTADEKMAIDDYSFKYVCDLIPETANGQLIQAKPQEQYNNLHNIALNRYGDGAFCRFRIPRNYKLCGVYVVTVNDEPKYVGECKNLSSRYNTGYGKISPKNCFKGGQETNCRLNKLILGEAIQGHSVKLWFMPTDDYKPIERDLRNNRQWPWNRI